MKNQMTFFDHLDELRSRIVKCLYVFFAGFVVAYFFSNQLLLLFKKPLFDALPAAQQKLYFTALFESFLVHLKVSAFASICVLSPIYFLLLWGFIAPGLRDAERRMVVPFVLGASTLFLAGVSFAYFFMLPLGVKYFLNYGPPDEVALLTLDAYISLLIKMLLGFGLAFQIPVVIVLLGKMGLLTPEVLKNHRKSAFVGITIVSAFVAPPDAISMLLLMAPLYMLYELSIVVLTRFNRT